MGAADTVMVSSVGEFAMSGVNIIDNINNFLVIAFIALSTGGAVVCSQYIGRQDHKSAALASKQLVLIVFVISLLITGIALLFRGPIIRIIYSSLEDDVMNAAMTYFLITALSYPLLALYNACAALYRSVGNTQVPMRIAVMVNVMNVGGNAYFIFGLHIGVAGVALSTLITRAVAALILLVMLIRNQRIPVSLSGLFQVRLVPSMIKRILNIGIPTGLENSMFQFGRLLTQRIFPIFGTSIIAANAVTSVLNSFSFMPGNAYSIAILTIVGQCLGAGDIRAARYFTVKLMKITWITIFFLAGFILITRAQLIGLFNLSSEARDAAMLFLNIHCISMVVGWSFSFALPNALRAAGDARFIMIVGTVSMWTVRVCAAYFFTFVLGIGPAGVWLAMGSDFLVRGTCFILRWRSGRWQNKKVIDN